MEVLQDIIERGEATNWKLTVRTFHTIATNASNIIVMWQGFFRNVPFGDIPIFVNNYLALEQHLCIRSATFLVLVNNIGSAVGGVLGENLKG